MNATGQSSFLPPLVEVVADKAVGRKSQVHTSPAAQRSLEGKQMAQCEVAEVEAETGGSTTDQKDQLLAGEVPAQQIRGKRVTEHTLQMNIAQARRRDQAGVH